MFGTVDRVVFDLHPDAIWIVDARTRRFLAVNPAAIAKYGYSREEFSGMTLDDLRPSREATVVLPRNAWVLDERRHVARNGTVLRVEVRTHDIEIDGRAAILMLLQGYAGHACA